MPRLSLDEVRVLARQVSWHVGVPPGLLVAMAVCESGDRNRPELGCDPLAHRVESHLPLVDGQPDESRGLLQILCSTARGLGVHALVALWNPTENLRIGARYLRQLVAMLSPEAVETKPGALLRLSDEQRSLWLLGVAAYNAGPGRVRRAVQRAGTSELAAVLDHLDGDPVAASRNERITKAHVEHVDRLWREEDERAA